jgi:cell division protein FtsA
MARNKKQSPNIVVALDIGTSKIVALVAKVTSSGRMELIGMGRYPSRGLRRGVVVDIDATVDAIQHAVDAAEQMSAVRIEHVYVGIAGSHIKSYAQHSMVTVSGDEISQNDVSRVVDDAVKRIAIPGDQKTLHVLTQEFIVDNQPGIRQPVGMAGVSLEVRIHMVTGAISAVRNLTRCVENCHLRVDDMVIEQLASAESVLLADEKELGVCLIDIGAGTTDIAVIIQGAIHHTSVIPVGGDQVTNDIAAVLRTPIHAAEEIKKNFGCALPQLVSPDEEIEVASVGDRPARCIKRHTLVDVIEARFAEIFQLIQQELHLSGYDTAIRAGGIVLTGGSSQIEGAVELAEEIFGVPVRLGLPDYHGGLGHQLRDASYATSVGLLKYASEHLDSSVVLTDDDSNSTEISTGHHNHSEDEGMMRKVKSWFANQF